VLAYIFWHHPRPEVDLAEYERSLRSFHHALAESGVEGFVRSDSFRLRGAPWINDGGDSYADWYLVEGSFALDPLNDVAVSGARRLGHDEAARASARGVGGLYRLVEGEAALDGGAAEMWLTKPRTTPYEQFYEWARPRAREGGGLWRRQMVLGPAPEFCLVTASAAAPPAAFDPIAVNRSELGSGSAAESGSGSA
jgi:hypothetical protein